YGYKIIKNNDEICVLGKVSNNGEAMSTSEFTSSDNINYNLTISADDYFISIYDEDGVLLRLFSNGSNNGNTLRHSGEIDFFKGEGDFYFSSMNIWFFNGADDFDTFGMTIPQVEGETEGLITRFTEDDGIVHYRNSLSVADYETSKFKVYPNPAQTEVFIKTDVPINKVSVYSIQGQKVFESSRSNINVEHLSSGLYFIKIEGANNTAEVKQFIKE
ncbi:T9SS type A sorting domain-containing protein, partial [Psychroserpens sp.]|uniref:T9SS type A sorting domain-containing protein n=1 Tax=Psychroserpens sp. TaxID=2020870 RepID=UPI00385B9FB2